MLGSLATASRLTPNHQGLLAVLSRSTCASMSTTSTTTTTTTTHDRGDRYGPMEWAQQHKKDKFACTTPIMVRLQTLSWTICKSYALHFKQVTTPSLVRSVNSVKAQKAIIALQAVHTVNTLCPKN